MTEPDARASVQKHGPSDVLREAIAGLWRIPAPGPQNLLSTPAFKRLSEAARTDYPDVQLAWPSFALANALRALGLPCQLPLGRNFPVVHPQEAARRLDQAFRAKRCRRRHLVPLDRAAELPDLTFGPVRLRKFSEADLMELVNATYFERVFPNSSFDASRFSMFQWLVVEEELSLDQKPGFPRSCVPIDHDFGQIEPHKGRFPPAVEKALFALLLAPWEEWSSGRSPDWRGFRAPWVYTMSEDIFAPLEPPRSADTLDWDILTSYDDEFGEHEYIEFFRPPLDDDAARRGLAVFSDAHWSAVESALRSPLFETPVAHFFVRAFLTEDVDEFLAHMTTIEAALGLRADYETDLRPKPDPHKNRGATYRLRARIAALLSDSSAAEIYETLFNVRSRYLHGRRMEEAIPSKKRKEARSLARRVVEALVRANEMSAPISRKEFLSDLLDRGALMLRAPRGAHE